MRRFPALESGTGVTMSLSRWVAGAVFTLGVSQAVAADLGTIKGPAPAPAPFFFVNDTQISLWYESNAKEPGVFTPARPGGVSIAKGVMSITHFDAYAYGTNFVNIDFLKSNNQDPSNGSAIGAGDGAMEVYGLYRGTLSFNSMFGTKAFTIPGVIKDVSFGFGFDANTKNTTFAPQKRDIVVGTTVAFDIPGVFNVSLYGYKEWNHCGITPFCTANVEFNLVPKVETNYVIPLTFTGLPLKFNGFTNVTWPKGRDGFGLKTSTEFLSHNRLTLDIGKLTTGRANFVDAFIGWQYWVNKFGNNYKIPANGGSKESQFIVGLAWHAL
jgi:hypothetical protein